MKLNNKKRLRERERVEINTETKLMKTEIEENIIYSVFSLS